MKKHTNSYFFGKQHYTFMDDTDSLVLSSIWNHYVSVYDMKELDILYHDIFMKNQLNK